MMDYTAGEQLIYELLENSTKFNDQGKAYQLLQEYFAGFPLTTLHPLLTNGDPMVQRAAVFVTSELGANAFDVVHNVVPLVCSEDRYTRYHALETIMVCSFAENVDHFVHIVKALQNKDQVIRVLAMHFLCRSDGARLEAAIRLLQSDGVHKEGLMRMVDSDSLNYEQIVEMIEDSNTVKRKYGAIVAQLVFSKFPELIEHTTSHTDDDLRLFAEEVLEEIQ